MVYGEVVVSADHRTADIDSDLADTVPDRTVGIVLAEVDTDPAEVGIDPAEAGIAPAEVDTDSAVFAVEKSSDFHNTGRNLFHLPLLNYN